jgi:hypothetical protein
MNTEKEILDYIVGIFPKHPGCVAMSQFHSQFVNIALPAYAKLQGEVELLQEEQQFDVTVQSIAPLTWDGVMVTARLPDDDLGPFLHYPPDIRIDKGAGH